MMKKLSIGVAGYCPPSNFDIKEARRMINEAYDDIEKKYQDYQIEIVSGLSYVGVLAIAYEEAVKRKWRTVGIASKKVLTYPLFPVDEKIIVGNSWGEESPTFISRIDGIVRIGMGEQSLRETKEVRESGKPTWEYDLPLLDQITQLGKMLLPK